MLKRNLFSILMISLALVFTSAAFGQENARTRKTQKSKRPQEINQSTIKTMKPPVKAQTSLGRENSIECLKEGEVAKAKSNKNFRPCPTGDGTAEQMMQMNMQIKLPSQKNAKVKSNTSTGNAMQPCAVGRENSIECLKAKNPRKANNYNLGDTATHRQRRRGN